VKYALTVVVAVLLLAACAARKPRPALPTQKPVESGPTVETDRPQSERYRDARDSGPAVPKVDIGSLSEPIPKPEPKARYGNKSPYSVLGKTYTVMDDASRYVERGIASWYGNKFHGYMTSSLERYDMYQFSAAHKTLPLPSYVRVTNLDNGKSVVVRVNDRGPFHENRLIDLSYAAAVRIGIWPKGTGLVEVRAINSAERDAEPLVDVAVPVPSGDPKIYLQLGAYADRGNAQRVLGQVQRAGIGRAAIVSTRINGRKIHRVRMGPLLSVEAADALVARIEKMGLGTPRVAIDK
jgi:rare lipoprotein A